MDVVNDRLYYVDYEFNQLNDCDLDSVICFKNNDITKPVSITVHQSTGKS